MRIEIDIRDNILPEIALECVKQVIASGKTSKDSEGKMHYCWGTTFETRQGFVGVFTREHRKNDCFVVQKVVL